MSKIREAYLQQCEIGLLARGRNEGRQLCAAKMLLCITPCTRARMHQVSFPSSSLFYFAILPLETRACSFITVLGNLLSSSRETSGRIYTRKIHYTVMGTTKRKLCVVSWIYRKKKKDSIKFDLECLVIIFMQDRKRNKHNAGGAFCPANKKIEKK